MFVIFEDFLDSLKLQGFHFLSTPLESQKRRKECLLRYDVHERDLANAYKLLEIETAVFEKPVSISFVMFRLFGFSDYEFHYENEASSRYMEYIEWCLNRDIEVQPHISPINEYIFRYQPEWAKLSEEEFKVSLSQNYKTKISNKGIEIDCLGKDFLHIDLLNERLIEILKEYEFLWEAYFGVKPKGYAVHGNDLPINRYLHNGILLDQVRVKEKYPIGFEMHSTETRSRFKHFSDCSYPRWMKDTKVSFPTKSQILVHPALWEDSIVHTLEPLSYIPPLDVITDPCNFIKSKLSLYEYNNLTRHCNFFEE